MSKGFKFQCVHSGGCKRDCQVVCLDGANQPGEEFQRRDVEKDCPILIRGEVVTLDEIAASFYTLVNFIYENQGSANLLVTHFALLETIGGPVKKRLYSVLDQYLSSTAEFYEDAVAIMKEKDASLRSQKAAIDAELRELNGNYLYAEGFRNSLRRMIEGV